MKLFKRRHKKEKEGSGKDGLAKGIAGFILKTQTAFAKFMSKRTEKISSSAIKLILIFFFLSGSSLSVYFIIAAFLKKDQSKAIKIDRLSIPRYYDKNGDESIQPIFFISKQEHEEMQTFQRYMDSLHHSKTGVHIYDSIMLSRPRLMDSVNKLEELYQQQLQNKK